MWLHLPKKIKKGTSQYYEYSLIKKRLPLRQYPENHSHHRHGDRSLCGKHHPIWYSDAGTSGFPGTPDFHGHSLVEHISGHALYRPDRLSDLLFPADRRFLPYFQQKEIWKKPSISRKQKIEGFFHTSSKKKYAIRLFLFALLSEFPFDYALFDSPVNLGYQNVFFTLFLGLLTIWGIDTLCHRAGNQTFLWIGKILIAAAGCLAAWLLQTDYDYKGIILILLLYLFHDQKFLCTLVSCLSLLWEAPACLAFIPINLYNGKRGISLKYFFYLFYPVHLLVYGLTLHFCFLN